MLFNSYIFIFLFLPLALAGYYGLNQLKKESFAQWFLVGMSLWFYAFFHIWYLLIIVGSIIVNFLISKILLCEKKSDLCKKIFLIAGICANVGVIFYYKYFNFFLENVNAVFGTNYFFEKILMPLGISFFTFQQISYLVDSYRQETKDYDFREYALFVTFFPQLVAGPIVLHQEMMCQFKDKTKKKFDQDMFARGLWFFSIGLFKKVMIADVLGRGVDWCYVNAAYLNGIEVAIAALLYTLQIYFDFSGYCNMACGIANMFQIELPQNFDSPYKAGSILEFWQRWHMSLTRFLRKYIYFPLGGNRKGTAITMLNIMMVYLISGIWHGAEWTFILWGLLHGVANVLCRLCKNIWEKIPFVIRWFSTFVFINLTWILFRAENIKKAGILFRKLLQPWNKNVNDGLLAQFDLLEFTYLEEHIAGLQSVVQQVPCLHLVIILGSALVIALVPVNCHKKGFKATLKNALGSIVLLCWSIVSLSGLSTFLYFNF